MVEQTDRRITETSTTIRVRSRRVDESYDTGAKGNEPYKGPCKQRNLTREIGSLERTCQVIPRPVIFDALRIENKSKSS